MGVVVEQQVVDDDLAVGVHVAEPATSPDLGDDEGLVLVGRPPEVVGELVGGYLLAVGRHDLDQADIGLGEGLAGLLVVLVEGLDGVGDVQDDGR